MELGSPPQPVPVGSPPACEDNNFFKVLPLHIWLVITASLKPWHKENLRLACKAARDVANNSVKKVKVRGEGGTMPAGISQCLWTYGAMVGCPPLTTLCTVRWTPQVSRT